MATRLYPLSKDETLLERLAGVAPGTAAALRAFEANLPPKPPRHDDHAAWAKWDGAHFDALSVRPELDALEHFRVFGWHRVTPRVLALLRTYGLEPADDATQTPEHVAALLAAQGVVLPEHVTPAELGGLTWR